MLTNQCGIPLTEEYDAAVAAWKRAHGEHLKPTTDADLGWVAGYARSFVDRRLAAEPKADPGWQPTGHEFGDFLRGLSDDAEARAGRMMSNQEGEPVWVPPENRQAEPPAPHTFETALGEVWKELGQLSPAMVSNDAVNKIVEAAYYAAENALYKAGVLKLVDGRLVVNRTPPHE